jgi:predicted nucleotidyltransferase
LEGDSITEKSIVVPEHRIAQFCRQNHIRKLSLFGSVLRDDFRPESDIDVLVEFDPQRIPGFFRLLKMQAELSVLLGGRKVDLRTPEDLSRYFRDEVVRLAEVQYAE